jgi:hypothetical protein
MAIISGDLLVTTFRGLMFGQRVQTSYGWVCTSSTSGNSTLSDQASLADAIGANTGTTLFSTYLACLSGSVDIDQIVVQKIWPVRQIRTIKPVAASGSAGVNTDVSNISVVISRGTEFGGRDQISNLHLPGPPIDTALALGVWQPAYLATVGLHAAESYDGITVAVAGGSFTINGAIIHRSGTPGAYNRISRHQVNPVARIMDRRTVGRGE